MGTILNNEQAEALLLDIRAARQAARTVVGERDGAFLVVPTSVVTGGGRGGQIVFPLRVGLEPGSLCTSGGRASVGGRVGEIEVSGWFGWRVGQGTPEPARYSFFVGGRPVAPPPWAAQLPHSLGLVRRRPSELGWDQARLVRQGRLAEHRLLRLTEQVLESCCRGPLRSVLGTHRLVDEADLVQRGLNVVVRLLPVYASARRPPRAWLGMVHLDAKRDMHRAVSQLDWLPGELGELVHRARLAGIELDAEPDVTLAALLSAALDNGQSLPRVSADQVRAALTAPELESFDAPWGSGHSWQPPEGGLSEPDPALDAVESRPGWAAATIAGLVSDEPDTILGAFLGDPRAVQQVADGVLARIRRRGEGRMAARHRSRQRFLTSGRLMRGSAFPEVPARELAALDAALREAIDLEPVA